MKKSIALVCLFLVGLVCNVAYGAGAYPDSKKVSKTEMNYSFDKVVEVSVANDIDTYQVYNFTSYSYIKNCPVLSNEVTCKSFEVFDYGPGNRSIYSNVSKISTPITESYKYNWITGSLDIVRPKITKNYFIKTSTEKCNSYRFLRMRNC